MSEANTFSIEYLVYIAGVLVPSSSISYTYAFNTFPGASIYMSPDIRLLGIGREDRVPVQIFLKNTFTPANTRENFNKFLLVFDGEVSSFGYANTETSREFVVNAQGVGNFMQDVNFAFVSSTNDMANANVTAEDFAAISVTQFALSFATSLFTTGITPGTKSGTLVEYPSQFLRNVIEFLSSDDTRFTGGRMSTMRLFYKKYCAELLKLPDRVVDVPFFDNSTIWKASGGAGNTCFPILQGLQAATALQQIVGVAETGIRRGTLFEFLTYIMDNMEYEFTTIGAPSCEQTSPYKLKQFMVKPIFYDAFPPTCNIIFPCHKSELRTTEDVIGAATRIRMIDESSLYSLLAHPDSSAITKSGMLDFWPRERTAGSEDTVTDSNQIAEELLKCEDFTGPYLFETVAPKWMSFVSWENVEKQSFMSFKDRIMKHLLLLKKYERRNLSVQTAFQPFVVPGFPGVVFDSTEEDFTFVGHVLTVQHTVSKRMATTTVEFGFVRDMQEATNPLTKIDNSVQVITDSVTQKLGNINNIYENIIGCNAVQFDDIDDVLSIRPEFLNNPEIAYEFTCRSITTLEQYMEFMGLTEEDSYVNSFGEKIITSFSGRYVEERQVLRGGLVLRDVLKEIAFRSRFQKIYENTAP